MTNCVLEVDSKFLNGTFVGVAQFSTFEVHLLCIHLFKKKNFRASFIQNHLNLMRISSSSKVKLIVQNI